MISMDLTRPIEAPLRQPTRSPPPSIETSRGRPDEELFTRLISRLKRPVSKRIEKARNWTQAGDTTGSLHSGHSSAHSSEEESTAARTICDEMRTLCKSHEKKVFKKPWRAHMRAEKRLRRQSQDSDFLEMQDRFNDYSRSLTKLRRTATQIKLAMLDDSPDCDLDAVNRKLIILYDDMKLLFETNLRVWQSQSKQKDTVSLETAIGSLSHLARQLDEIRKSTEPPPPPPPAPSLPPPPHQRPYGHRPSLMPPPSPPPPHHHHFPSPFQTQLYTRPPPPPPPVPVPTFQEPQPRTHSPPPHPPSELLNYLPPTLFPPHMRFKLSLPRLSPLGHQSHLLPPAPPPSPSLPCLPTSMLYPRMPVETPLSPPSLMSTTSIYPQGPITTTSSPSPADPLDGTRGGNIERHDVPSQNVAAALDETRVASATRDDEECLGPF